MGVGKQVLEAKPLRVGGVGSNTTKEQGERGDS